MLSEIFSDAFSCKYGDITKQSVNFQRCEFEYTVNPKNTDRPSIVKDVVACVINEYRNNHLSNSVPLKVDFVCSDKRLDSMEACFLAYDTLIALNRTGLFPDVNLVWKDKRIKPKTVKVNVEENMKPAGMTLEQYQDEQGGRDIYLSNRRVNTACRMTNQIIDEVSVNSTSHKARGYIMR